ncbi:translocase of chloroplast [Forsythia ovata]|uniref:Translocase of chloroplast n=1 Tax=Forsythia ovata TaxID=205694 RepID=A0ABD1S2P5_9LAMI
MDLDRVLGEEVRFQAGVTSEAAKQFIEELERGSGVDSSHEHSQGIDGQIITDSEEEADTDEEWDDPILGQSFFNVLRHLSAVMAAKHVERRDPVAGESLGAYEDPVWYEERRVVEEFMME